MTTLFDLTSENILCAAEYGLCAAHIKHENIDYYGEVFAQENRDEIMLCLLLPSKKHKKYWLISEEFKTFRLKSCSVVKLTSIEGQNLIQGFCDLGFEWSPDPDNYLRFTLLN